MKTRTPNSIAAAVNKAKALLGVEFIAELLDCSLSMVYKLSDDEHARSLTLARAIEIDIATHGVCGMTPMLDFFLAQLPHGVKKEHAADHANAVFKLTKDIGDLAGRFADFTTNKSQSGRELSLNEKAALADALDCVIDNAKTFKHGLN